MLEEWVLGRLGLVSPPLDGQIFLHHVIPNSTDQLYLLFVALNPEDHPYLYL